LEALGLNLGYLLVQIFNFAIIFVVLRAWVYKPILNLLDQRRERIAQGLEDARVAAEARENAEEEARKIVADAQAKANQVVREATDRAEAASRDVMTQAEEDAARAREAALADAEQERERVLGDLRGQVAALSMAAARKLIGESLTAERQHDLINEFFSGIRNGRIAALKDENVQGQTAEVTSALPLTDQEKETVRQELSKHLGSVATVTFRVDPSILGGLVIRVGDKVLDASISGQLEEMAEALR
jgi:F-type H+-transporting ATPase subunit b